MQPIMPPRKNKAEITGSTSTLREVTEPSYGQEATTVTRAEKRRASAMDVNAADIEGIFGSLLEILGQSDLSEPTPDITPLQIDTIAAELIAVRDAKDVIEGRESALKAYASEVIDMQSYVKGNEPKATSGYLLSPENGVKLSKEVSGGKLTVDVDLLENILDTDQFESVTNLIQEYRTVTYPDGKTVEETKNYREINEEALEKQLKLGNIGMEQVIKATTPSKTRTAFYVRSL